MIRSHTLFAFALLSVGAVTTPSVRAQTSAPNKAVAESLFRQGRELMSAGKLSEGCAKLGESQRLDPQIGTLLNLAACDEKQGKVASAWAEFGEVLADAQRAGQKDRADYAQQRVTALEKLLSRVVVNVEHPLPGERITLDGSPLGAAAWGSPVPIDPGEHVLEGEAAGKKRATARFTVVVGTPSLVVTFPELARDVPIEAPPTPPSGAPDAASAPFSVSAAPGADTGAKGSNRATIGLVVGAAGVVAIGAGAYFGLQAIGNKNDSNADNHCDATNRCDATGLDLRSSAKTDATVATIATGVGIAAVGAGAYLFFSAPRDRARPAAAAKERARVVALPAIGTTPGSPWGMIVRGDW